MGKTLSKTAVLLVTILALLCGMVQRLQAGPIQSYFETSDGKMVWDEDFIKLLRDKLDTRYESLEVVVSACYSGGFVTAAKDAKHGLQGTWSATASREINRCQSTKGDKNPTRPKTGTDPAQEIAGLKIGDFFFHGWDPQYIKQLIDKPTSTNKELADTAFQKDVFLPPPPDATEQYASSGAAADNRGVHSGSKSNHSLVFVPKDSEVTQDTMPKLVEALQGAGYKKEEIDFAFDSDKGKKIGAEKGKEQEVTRNTTLDDLNRALDAVDTALRQNPGQEKAYIFIGADGNSDRRAAPKKPGGEEDQPKQGAIFNPSNNSVNIAIDEAFREALEQKVPNGSGGFLFDDPNINRTGPSKFLLTTVDESVSGPVLVRLDGILAGSLSLNNSTSGGDYALDLSDATIVSLAPLLTDSTLQVSFDFAGASDFFQIATEGDLFDDPLFSFGHYGISVAPGPANADEVVPEPPVLFLLVPGLAGILLCRRRTPRRT